MVGGTQPLARVLNSSHAELHALRLGLSCVFRIFGAHGARVTERGAAEPGEAVKARGICSRYVFVRAPCRLGSILGDARRTQKAKTRQALGPTGVDRTNWHRGPADGIAAILGPHWPERAQNRADWQRGLKALLRAAESGGQSENARARPKNGETVPGSVHIARTRPNSPQKSPNFGRRRRLRQSSKQMLSHEKKCAQGKIGVAGSGQKR